MIEDLFDDLGKFIIDKFLNPCKKCLVRAVCKPVWTSCDNYTQYLDRIDVAGDAIKMCAIILLLFMEFFIIIIVIGPELYGLFKSIF